MTKKIGLIIISTLVLVGVGFYYMLSGEKTVTNKNMNPTSTLSPEPEQTPPAMQIDKTKKYQAVLKTDDGDITIELNVTKTPITSNNFIYLAKKGFYNGTIFHRVMNGFMIQGGDPTGTGAGGPGYKFDDEPFDGDYVRGTVSMANSGPNTNGSQFFIMHKDVPLKKDYVIFGKVVKGMEVVDKIAEEKVVADPNTGEESKPVTPVHITSVEIKEL